VARPERRAVGAPNGDVAYVARVTALVVLLTVLGGVLPIAAIVEATVIAQRKFGELDQDLRRIQEIGDAGGNPDDATPVLDRIHAVRAPSIPNYYWIEYGPDIAERNVFRELKRPAVLAGVGVVFSTAGSLLSLCL
jgi:hypothetical protein